jgi:hypothetical protein
VNKHAEHVEQHALASLLNDPQNLHIDQSREHNGLSSVDDTGVVDLANDLMRLVHRVNERQSNMVRLGFELGQDGFAERFGRYACAIGDKKYAALGHEFVCVFKKCSWAPSTHIAGSVVSIVGQLPPALLSLDRVAS